MEGQGAAAASSGFDLRRTCLQALIMVCLAWHPRTKKSHSAAANAVKQKMLVLIQDSCVCMASADLLLRT